MQGAQFLVANGSMVHLDHEMLAAAFRELKGGKAPGVDGVTKAEYVEHLDANIENLVARLRRDAYTTDIFEQCRCRQPLRGHLESEMSSVARPAILVESSSQPRSERIEMNVGCHGQQGFAVVERLAAKPPTKQRAVSTVQPIDLLGIPVAEVAYGRRQIATPRGSR